ncbi:hypothetical protein JAAARDRAFT_42864 [Jaapia argillacea MUCL 33604]|uniref:Uncharacterized protein n=1 Tax=Jaapia argillacea MUCL 33604 TaxID=933084 RepID=A0A067P3P7_9AGAM|nr:hypothetical protein JAAARDRAFT_42864 [Jaapia argillacea MUCL 33604]
MPESVAPSTIIRPSYGIKDRTASWVQTHSPGRVSQFYPPTIAPTRAPTDTWNQPVDDEVDDSHSSHSIPPPVLLRYADGRPDVVVDYRYAQDRYDSSSRLVSKSSKSSQPRPTHQVSRSTSHLPNPPPLRKVPAFDSSTLPRTNSKHTSSNPYPSRPLDPRSQSHSQLPGPSSSSHTLPSRAGRTPSKSLPNNPPSAFPPPHRMNTRTYHEIPYWGVPSRGIPTAPAPALPAAASTSTLPRPRQTSLREQGQSDRISVQAHHQQQPYFAERTPTQIHYPNQSQPAVHHQPRHQPPPVSRAAPPEVRPKGVPKIMGSVMLSDGRVPSGSKFVESRSIRKGEESHHHQIPKAADLGVGGGDRDRSGSNVRPTESEGRPSREEVTGTATYEHGPLHRSSRPPRPAPPPHLAPKQRPSRAPSPAPIPIPPPASHPPYPRAHVYPQAQPQPHQQLRQHMPPTPPQTLSQPQEKSKLKHSAMPLLSKFSGSRFIESKSIRGETSTVAGSDSDGKTIQTFRSSANGTSRTPSAGTAGTIHGHPDVKTWPLFGGSGDGKKGGGKRPKRGRSISMSAASDSTFFLIPSVVSGEDVRKVVPIQSGFPSGIKSLGKHAPSPSPSPYSHRPPSSQLSSVPPPSSTAAHTQSSSVPPTPTDSSTRKPFFSRLFSGSGGSHTSGSVGQPPPRRKLIRRHSTK